MSRKDQILRAVDGLIRVHDEWQQAENGPEVPTERYEEAVENCVGIVCNGDIPSECRELESAVSRFALEWGYYRDGVKMTSNGSPFDALWAAYKVIVQARRGAIQTKPRTLESVAKLIQEKVPNLQIAKMYGIRQKNPESMFDPIWEGPFFDKSGRVRHDLIEMQAKFDRGEKDAERIVPEDWIHPSELTRVEEESRELDKRLKLLDEQELNSESTPPYEDPATIEELLREGQFPATIAKVKNCTLSEVMEISERIGLEPNDPDASETWELQHPEGTGAEVRSEDGIDDETAELNDTIIQIAESDEMKDGSAGDVAKAVNALLERDDVNPQKVAAILREHKKAATA